MRRRNFISLVGAAAAWPLAVRAQQPAKPPTIGFLGGSTPSLWSAWVSAFVQRLRELGWVEGRNVAIEYRWAEERNERYTKAANRKVLAARAQQKVATAQTETEVASNVVPLPIANR